MRKIIVLIVVFVGLFLNAQDCGCDYIINSVQGKKRIPF